MCILTQVFYFVTFEPPHVTEYNIDSEKNKCGSESQSRGHALHATLIHFTSGSTPCKTAVADRDMEIMEEERPEEDSGDERHRNPWPNLEDVFAFKPQIDTNIIMQCRTHLPRRTERSAYKTSTSNLRKHVAECWRAFVFYIIIDLFIVWLKRSQIKTFICKHNVPS